MTIALNMLLGSIIPATPVPTVETASVPEDTSLTRIYKTGDEASYNFTISDSSSSMKFGIKMHVKTLALLDGGKASQELSATLDASAPAGMPSPSKATWTFGNNGLTDTNFDLHGGGGMYSILAFLSFVPGNVSAGKEFKMNWTSPDKKSTLTGTGTYEGTKDLNGTKVAVVKTTFTVAPATESAGTFHNTASFDPTTGKLVSAEGTIEADGHPVNFTITSG
jgi:hypothetical protein